MRKCDDCGEEYEPKKGYIDFGQCDKCFNEWCELEDTRELEELIEW